MGLSSFAIKYSAVEQNFAVGMQSSHFVEAKVAAGRKGNKGIAEFRLYGIETGGRGRLIRDKDSVAQN